MTMGDLLCWILLIGSCFSGVNAFVNLNEYMTVSGTDSNQNYPVSGTIDGNYVFEVRQCMASNPVQEAWWRGKIDKVARIQNIVITFKEGTRYRADGYSLYVSNETTLSSGHLCYQDVDTGNPNVTENITCHVTGQYVMIVITRQAPEKAYMDLCEVDVYGCFVFKYGNQCEKTCYCKYGCNPENGNCDATDCQAGWRGEHCDQECKEKTFGENCLSVCHCKNSGCNRENGQCTSQGCEAGFEGIRCDQGCINTKFGEDCNSICHCEIPGCNAMTGQCNVSGCAAGWKGNSCSTACSVNEFGKDCLQYCHCKDGTCNKFNGTCNNPSGGCQDGWNGTSCEKECVAPYFGSSCSSQCNCKTQGCNHISGVCTALGCLDGWQGDSCDKVCDYQQFGTDCATTCHCVEGGCDHVTGKCNIAGCEAGWRGESCSQECAPKSFGLGCTAKCNCKADSCHHVNGTCSSPGCTNGWTGPSCSDECQENTFEEDCRMTCHCKVPGCDRFNGTCDEPEEGCDDGWKGMSCSKKCDSGRFGARCASQCRCATDGCDHVSGNCSVPGCNPGYTGIACSEQCPDFVFGKDCNFTCGNCVNSTSCHHVTGICDYGCDENFHGDSCIEETTPTVGGQSQPGNSFTGIIAGAVGGVLVIVVAIAIILKRRSNTGGKAKEYRQNENTTQKLNVSNVVDVQVDIKDNESHVSLDIEDSEDNLDECEYVNTPVGATVRPDTSMNKEHFLEMIEGKEAQGLLDEEYKGLPRGAVHPQAAGNETCNKPKNRFKTTFPYDHSRVILKDKGASPGADYINANYIDNTTGERAYIATQGPLQSTTDDFWLMIWQDNCRTIVMLANLYEDGRQKCFQYWPDMGHPTKSPHFEIRLLNERQFASYVTRLMTVKNISNGQERQVKHFHFTKWPDHGTPDAFELIMFQQHIQRLRSNSEGLMTVHCSAGIGRTGTLIGLDALLAAGRTQNRIDVKGYVEIMRKDRMNMVQTADQYKVLHLALSEGLSSPVSLQSKTTFLGTDKGDLETVPANQTKIKREFQILHSMNTVTQKRLKYECATSYENNKKNRTMDVLAGSDQYRQILFSCIPGRNNYINAVKISSFRKQNGYLVTQFPLEDTAVDFWSLVMDTGSRSVVCLKDSTTTRKDQPLWPNQQNMVEVEPYQIKYVSMEREEYGISAFTLDLKNEQNGSKRRIKLFSVNEWKDDELIPNNQNVLCKLHYLVEDWLQQSEEEGPTIVTCLDGAEHCGLYCLISTTIERLDMVSEIDIFATARQLQLRRPQFIDNFEQYRYAYSTITTLLQRAENTYINQDEALYANT